MQIPLREGKAEDDKHLPSWRWFGDMAARRDGTTTVRAGVGGTVTMSSVFRGLAPGLHTPLVSGMQLRQTVVRLNHEEKVPLTSRRSVIDETALDEESPETLSEGERFVSPRLAKVE